MKIKTLRKLSHVFHTSVAKEKERDGKYFKSSVYGIYLKAKQRDYSSFYAQWCSFVKVLHSKRHLVSEQGV